MKKCFLFALVAAFLFLGCKHPSRADQYRQEKHLRDSTALVDQQRSLNYYQSLLDSLTPVADSILPAFKYEKNEKYQDHGYYVIAKNNVRVLVRDDAQAPVVYYAGKPIEQNDKRLNKNELNCIEKAYRLYVLMADIRELELRIARTSLEIQKYQKRLQK